VEQFVIDFKRHRNDWTAYLTHADELEEAGDVVRAALLRRQGELLRILRDAVLPAARSERTRTFKVVGDLPNGGGYVVRCCPKVVVLYTSLTPDGPFPHLNLQRSILRDPKRADYLPSRLREHFGFDIFNGTPQPRRVKPLRVFLRSGDNPEADDEPLPESFRDVGCLAEASAVVLEYLGRSGSAVRNWAGGLVLRKMGRRILGRVNGNGRIIDPAGRAIFDPP
jgi:hypothetical protein